MYSGLLASLGFAGLLLIAPAALAAEPGCCSDKAQAAPAAQPADKGCCGEKSQAAPVADKACCGEKAPAAHAVHAADKADKPQAAQASHACCDMPCCKDKANHKNHVPAMAMLEADATAIFLMTMQTDPPAPPVVAARPGTPTIR
ncbi:MAG: hypothetical protein Q8T13_19950 [Acidobacteriota bacterium]|nr:hypothetical protein [Acidobacteriota bacterium]